jgi:outer membrane protein assembly factor BamB
MIIEGLPMTRRILILLLSVSLFSGCAAEPADPEPICYECIADAVLKALADSGIGPGTVVTDGGPNGSDVGPGGDVSPSDVMGTDTIEQGDTGSNDASEIDAPTSSPDIPGVDPLSVTLQLAEGETYSAYLEIEPQVIGGGVIAGVEFKLNGVALHTDLIAPYSYTINTAAVGDGEHVISAETADNEGQWATASVGVIFDNTPPEFESLNPVEAQAIFYEDGPLHMEAISDDVNPLSEVKFFANGLPQGEFDEGPYVADIEWEDIFVYYEDLGDTGKEIYLSFQATDKLGLETSVDYNVSVHKRSAWHFETLGDIWASPEVLPNGNIVVGNWQEKLYCITPAGDQVWQYGVFGDVNFKAVYDPGSDRIIVGDSASQVYGVTTSGGLAWQTAVGGPVGGEPTVHGGKVYVGTYSGSIVVLNPSNGSIHWQANVCNNLSSNPAVAQDETVYVGCQDSKLYAVNNGTVQWTKETGKEIWGSPSVGPTGTVYFGSNDGWLYAQNADGSDAWTTEIGGAIWGTPAIGLDGNIYVGSTSKYVTKLDAITGEIIWETKTQGLTYSSPRQGSDGTVYIGTSGGQIWALDDETGNVKWNNVIGDTIHGSVLIHNEVLYAGSVDRNVYALKLAP